MRGNPGRRGAGAIALLMGALVALVVVPSPALAPALTPASPPSTVYAFGDNAYGELGEAATAQPNPTPQAVALPYRQFTLGGGLVLSTTVAAAAVGDSHSLVLTTAGRLYAFGFDNDGQLGNGSGSSASIVPTPTHVTLPSGAAVTAIAAGVQFSLAVSATGQLYAFGDNGDGQLGTSGTGELDSPTLVTFPHPADDPADQPKVAAVAAAGFASFAITSDGELYAFGADTDGQLGLPAATTRPTLVNLPGASGPVTQVAAGNNFTLALTASGQLYGFGDNSLGQLGVQLPGTTNFTVTPTLVTPLPGQHGAVTQVAAGGNQTLVVTASGQLYSFGLNLYGELGESRNVGTTVANQTPALVPMPPSAGPVRQVAASGYASYAVTANGTLYSFGINNFGQLGDSIDAGTMAPDPDPVPVSMPGGARVETVARGANAMHMLAIISNLAITTTTLPAGRVDAPYSQTVAASAGVTPYSWSASGLPHGLAISSGGEITGTPSAAGNANVVLSVTDADGISVSSTPIRLTIASATTTTTTTTTTTGSGGTTTTGGTAVAARLRSQLRPRGGGAAIGALLRTGGYRLSLHGLGAGTVAISWRHRASAHAPAVLVASGKAHAGARAVVVAIRLTPAGRRLLAHAKRLTLTVAGTLTPAGSKAISAQLTVTLTRRRAA